MEMDGCQKVSLLPRTSIEARETGSTTCPFRNFQLGKAKEVSWTIEDLWKLYTVSD
jgi:hypothetical protein